VYNQRLYFTAVEKISQQIQDKLAKIN